MVFCKNYNIKKWVKTFHLKWNHFTTKMCGDLIWNGGKSHQKHNLAENFWDSLGYFRGEMLGSGYCCGYFIGKKLRTREKWLKVNFWWTYFISSFLKATLKLTSKYSTIPEYKKRKNHRNLQYSIKHAETHLWVSTKSLVRLGSVFPYNFFHSLARLVQITKGPVYAKIIYLECTLQL